MSGSTSACDASWKIISSAASPEYSGSPLVMVMCGGSRTV
jgi:hypothetical protein